MVTRIYKLDANPRKYVRPGSRPLGREAQFRQYVAKRKFEVAFGEYQKRQKFYRRQRFVREWGIVLVAAVQVGFIALVMFLQHLGVPGF